MKAALKHAGVRTTQATHASRKAGAQIAELNGASPAEIARAGRWVTGVMENVYLTNFSLPAMRALAGFPSEVGSYYLPRYVDVPEELQRKVFPEVERW